MNIRGCFLPPMSKVLLPGGKLSFISFRPLEPSGNWYESRCTSIDGAMLIFCIIRTTDLDSLVANNCLQVVCRRYVEMTDN